MVLVIVIALHEQLRGEHMDLTGDISFMCVEYKIVYK